MPDNEESLGDQQTFEGGAQPADSSDRSLGDQSTFGGGGESSLSDIGGLTHKIPRRDTSGDTVSGPFPVTAVFYVGGYAGS
jgi:hypothetical protein